MKTRLPTLTLLAALAGALPLMAAASVIKLGFEGLGDFVAVGTYGNTNNVGFSGNAFSVVSLDTLCGSTPCSGNFSSRTGADGLLSVTALQPGSTGPKFSLDATDGFNIFSFYYSSTEEISVTVSGGTNAGSTTTVLAANAPGQPACGNQTFDCWFPIAIDLGKATGTHVEFSGAAGSYLVDDIWLTTNTGGGGTVPEPTSLALVALALAGVGAATRRRPGA